MRNKIIKCFSFLVSSSSCKIWIFLTKFLPGAWIFHANICCYMAADLLGYSKYVTKYINDHFLYVSLPVSIFNLKSLFNFQKHDNSHHLNSHSIFHSLRQWRGCAWIMKYSKVSLLTHHSYSIFNTVCAIKIMKRLPITLSLTCMFNVFLLPRRQEQHVTPGHCWKQNSLNNDYDYTPCIPFSVLLYYLGAVERERERVSLLYLYLMWNHNRREKERTYCFNLSIMWK